MGSHQHTKFGGHRHCGSGNMLILICQVISQDLVMKGTYDFKVSYHPATFGTNRHSGSGDMFLVFHMILTGWRHPTCLISLIWVNSSRCTCLPNLGIIGLMEMDISILISITWQESKLTGSVHHTGRFLKSGILIHNSEVPDTAGRKTRRRRRAQEITKRYAFHANAKMKRDFYSCK